MCTEPMQTWFCVYEVMHDVSASVIRGEISMCVCMGLCMSHTIEAVEVIV